MRVKRYLVNNTEDRFVCVNSGQDPGFSKAGK